MSRLRHDVQQEEETVGGIVYRLARSEEDLQKCVDFYFDVFVKGAGGIAIFFYDFCEFHLLSAALRHFLCETSPSPPPPPPPKIPLC